MPSLYNLLQNKTDEVFIINFKDIDIDIVKDLSDKIYDLCGSKGGDIAMLVPYELNIPEFFIATGNFFKLVFWDILEKNKNINLEGTLKLDKEFIDSIKKSYRLLCGVTDKYVAVRPSLTIKKDISLSGVFPTILNVRGAKNVVKAFEQLYSLFWNKKLDMFFEKNRISRKDVKLSIIVQRMVTAEVSGVLYSKNIITGNSRELLIESVYGLSDVLVNGLINPDQYIINKATEKIREKNIFPQEWMHISGGATAVKKVKISREWQKKTKLSNLLIKDLVHIGKLLEVVMNHPVKVEWVYEGGKFWLLRIHPISAARVNIGNKPQSLKAINKVKKHLKSKSKISSNFSVMHGVSNGVNKKTNGIAIVVDESIFSKLDKVVQLVKNADIRNIILVVPSLSKQLEKLLPYIKGIVSNTGSLSGDLVLEAMSLEIPVITQVELATWNLKTGDYIKIDGNNATVRLAPQRKLQHQQSANKSTNIIDVDTISKVFVPYNLVRRVQATETLYGVSVNNTQILENALQFGAKFYPINILVHIDGSNISDAVSTVQLVRNFNCTHVCNVIFDVHHVLTTNQCRDVIRLLNMNKLKNKQYAKLALSLELSEQTVLLEDLLNIEKVDIVILNMWTMYKSLLTHRYNTNIHVVLEAVRRIIRLDNQFGVESYSILDNNHIGNVIIKDMLSTGVNGFVLTKNYISGINSLNVFLRNLVQFEKLMILHS